MRVIPNTATIETAKTVVIAVLITAIVSFVAGAHYEQGNVVRIQNAAAKTVQTVK